MQGCGIEENVEDSKITAALAESIRYDSETYRIGIIVGQCIGGVACLGGLLLTILGLSGQIEWILEAAGFTSRLANASPGIVFEIVGLFILIKYKPAIRDQFATRSRIRSSLWRRIARLFG